MTEDEDLAQQVAESDDRVAQKLYETGLKLTEIGSMIDAIAPMIVGNMVLTKALTADAASRDSGAIQRLAGLVEPLLDRQHAAVRQAVEQMLNEALDLAALGAADSKKPQ